MLSRAHLSLDRIRYFQHKRKNFACYADYIMRRPAGAIFYILVLYLLCIPGMLCASSLKISWNPNTESDLGGYRVYYGNAARDYDYALNVGSSTSVTIDGFLEGYTYYIAVTAYDYSGNESSFSREVSVSVPGDPGGGVISSIVSWLFGIIDSVGGSSGISQYNLSDFSSARAGDVVDSLRVVRLGLSGNTGSAELDDAGMNALEGYVIRDVMAEVGQPVDLLSIYPRGTYFFLPLTENSAVIENDIFYSWEPGVYLYMVTDVSGDLIHLLRVSVLNFISLFSEYISGEEMMLEDSDLGITFALPSHALEGNSSISFGWTYSELTGSGAVFIDNTRVLEFAIAPFGLMLSEPAEVRVRYDRPEDPVVEYYDEGEERWIPIEGARVEGGVVAFSTQSLGRFKVYPEPGEAAGGSSSGGGCFISSCVP